MQSPPPPNAVHGAPDGSDADADMQHADVGDSNLNSHCNTFQMVHMWTVLYGMSFVRPVFILHARFCLCDELRVTDSPDVEFGFAVL